MWSWCTCECIRGDTVDPATADVSAAPVGPVTVHIVGARGLRNADWLPGQGKSDCFCTCEVAGQLKFKTHVVSDSLVPVWSCEFNLDDRQPGQPLDFAVFDQDVGKHTDFLGKVQLECGHFESQGFHGELALRDSGKDGHAFVKVKVKPRGKEYPAGPSIEFRSKLERPEGRDLGLDLDFTDEKTAFINAIKPGAVMTYNGTAAPNTLVENGYYIVGVNDLLPKAATADLLRERLASSGPLELILRRPMLFQIGVRKTKGESLGVDIKYDTNSTSLMIRKINAGPIRNWNVNHLTEQVQALDRIVSVNGVTGSASHLCQAIEKGQELELLISRPSVDGWFWWS